MLRPLLVALVASSVVLAASPTHAQTGDGGLRGYVKDEQGGILPGVTVTATGPELLAPVVVVSATDGSYRLINLPPGTYTITAELAGFAIYQRQGILVRAGSTFGVDIDMRLGSLAETITVSGDSPMIEVHNPATTLNVDGELVRAAPVTSRRLFSDVVEMAPGVRSRNVTGGTPGRVLYYHGAEIWGNVFQIEGAPAGSYYDGSSHVINMGGDMIQDAEIKLGGADASSPLSTGVIMNVITPRGGNKLTGSAAWSYQPLSWNGDNTQNGRIKGGVPTTQETKQWDASLGGPIVKDKVWFFGAYRYADLVNGISRSSTDLALLRAFRPNFELFDNTYNSHQPFFKVTSQISAMHELSAFYQYDLNDTILGTERDEDQLNRSALGGGMMQFKLNSVWTNRLASMFSVAYNTKGGNNKKTYNLPYGVGPQVIVHQDAFLSSGVPTGTGRLVQMNNLQSVSYLPASMLVLRGDLTYFKDGWGGSHEFKTGIWAAPQLNRDILTRYLNDGFVLEEVRQIDPNNASAGTVPFHRQYRTPTEVTTTVARDEDFAVYVQDSWKPHPRITMNVGVRVDFIRRHDEIFDIDRMKSVEVGPRLGVAYLLTSDARTVLRASYGRIAEQVNGRDVITPFASGLPRGALIRNLYDANGDGIWESEVLTPAATATLSGVEFDPGLHQPFVDDFIVGLRRQLPGQLSIDVSVTRRYYRGFYALVDVNGFYPDGPYQPFGGFGKVDPNRGIIYQMRNNTWSSSVITALEGVVAKNLSNNVQFLLSLNRQWAHESGTWNPTDPARFIQPDAFPNNRMILLGHGVSNDENNLSLRAGLTNFSAYRPYTVAFTGQYFAPWGIILAGSYMIQAGDYPGAIVDRLAAPDPRFGPPTVRLANGTTQPNPLATVIRFAYPTRGEGQVQNEDARYLQLSVGRAFKAGEREFDARLTVFNVFNAGPNTQYASGAFQLFSVNYLQSFIRHPPRAVAVSLRFRF
jgi:hypothetical protein